jgi:starch phosphorylase
VLRALGVEPAAWHANEGHAAFMLLERVREHVVAGQSFDEAVQTVRDASIFTTHTPVPAGHDTFDPDKVVECVGPIWEELGLTQAELLGLGRHPTTNGHRFNMTVLAMRLSRGLNGVSQRHGAVSREMFTDLWPGREAGTVPVKAITNGVHLATWMANPVMGLLDRHLGPDWGTRLDDPALWAGLDSLDAATLWDVHQGLKEVLFRLIREDTRRRFADDWKDATQGVGAGDLLDPQTLTIGFARRFATYKRANLIFRDPERLNRLLVNVRRPVQIVIAGKAHPADTPGKEVLQSVYRFTHDPFYEGRVAFVEDYGMHPAHLLVQGVDLWLNLPRVPMEASGTSGMKAGLNGVPQLSTLDGWWEEGYDGTNGWAIPRASEADDTEATDAADAEALYALLENEVVPLFYERDDAGVPTAWVERMRNAIRVAASRFTADRMVRDYAELFYVPMMHGLTAPDDPPTG